jgi:transcriptional regulator with XRE-family HTH domain
MHATKPVNAATLFGDVFESATEKQSLKEHLHARKLVSKLVALRAAKGFTQTTVAQAMGCKQAKISKLESGEDADLSMKDLLEYARAIGCEATVMVSDRGKSLAEQIKQHAFCIRNAFMKLVELSHKDDEIARGVAKLHFEAFQNINRFLMETADKLPVDSESGEPYLHIAATDECEPQEDAHEPTVKLPRRRVKKSHAHA